MAMTTTGAKHANPAAASVTGIQPAAKSASAGAESTPSESSPSAPADTVQTSDAAKTALQEAAETRFQMSESASNRTSRLTSCRALGQNG